MGIDQAAILVVDDDPTNRYCLEGTLRRRGYETASAASGSEALDAVRERHPLLILLDVVLPDRSGMEVCRMLKADPATASIPVIFVTALSEASTIVEGFAAGGSDFITKPFRLAEVIARVNVHVRLHEAESRLLAQNREMERLTRQLRSANRELETLSRTDPLTQLLNRRVWEKTAQDAAADSEKRNSPYCIIMIDVDYFKLFNDTQGHQAGDACLRRLADSLSVACRKSDSIGRYGGEEFVVLAPDTNIQDAILLAERIRRTIWTMNIDHPANRPTCRITASLGVAAAVGLPWEKTLKQADEALYSAKHAGRNIVYAEELIGGGADECLN